MSRKFGLVIIEIFAKKHAFQNLQLAIILVSNQPVVHSRYLNNGLNTTFQVVSILMVVGVFLTFG